MRLRIVSDGTTRGTKVLNTETGEEIKNVTSVDWAVYADGVKSTATITFRDVEIDAYCDVEVRSKVDLNGNRPSTYRFCESCGGDQSMCDCEASRCTRCGGEWVACECLG